MLETILPEYITGPVRNLLNPDKLFEIRLRGGRAVSVGYGTGYYYLHKSGIKTSAEGAVICPDELPGEVIIKASDYSLYAVNNQLCEGFMTIRGGMRLGVSGEIVFDGERIKTIKNFNALDIRVPHEVKGCADKIYDFIASNKQVKNTLIVSPPGLGKTTLLRDISRKLASSHPIRNVLIADERCEIAAASDGKPQLDVGINADVLSNCSKNYAFTSGIRSLRPDVIVTDELWGDRDAECVLKAVYSGVSVIASLHASSGNDLKSKPAFSPLVASRCFDRYVFLGNKEGPGTLEAVLDQNMDKLYGH